jgi:hypothetical protein
MNGFAVRARHGLWTPPVSSGRIAVGCIATKSAACIYEACDIAIRVVSFPHSAFCGLKLPAFQHFRQSSVSARLLFVRQLQGEHFDCIHADTVT